MEESFWSFTGLPPKTCEYCLANAVSSTTRLMIDAPDDAPPPARLSLRAGSAPVADESELPSDDTAGEDAVVPRLGCNAALFGTNAVAFLNPATGEASATSRETVREMSSICRKDFSTLSRMPAISPVGDSAAMVS